MHTVFEDSTVRVVLEEHPYYKILIHVDSKKWNKSTFLHYIDIWIEMGFQLRELGIEEVYAAIEPSNKKLQKFSEMFGFLSTGTILKSEKGTTREIYKCLI